jgi:hypothetical protein
MFYAGEFIHAFTICVLTAILFLGGWRGPGATIAGGGGALIGFVYLFLKSMAVYFVVMLVRSTVPRIRIDQMMAFNWKFLVPLSLVNVLAVALVAKLFQPDYGFAYNVSVTANGLTNFIYQVLGPNTIAELPRVVALLVVNIVIWLVASRLLHQYADLERRQVQALVTEPAEFSPEHASAPVGR